MRTLPRRFAPLLAALLLLAACGDDNDHHAATPTPVRTPTGTPKTPTATPTAVATNTSAPTSTAVAATATATTAPSSTATPSATSAPSHTPTAPPTPTATSAVPNPLIEGPVTGGSGGPFVQSTLIDLAELGYQQAEYFVTGTASAFVNTAALDSDGVWPVERADQAGYRTRIVVYRPIDAAHFNGTVLVEWLNVSGGLDAAPDWTGMHTELVREGYVWVGVSAQRVGIEGGGGAFNLSLKAIDPARYGSLHHPGDSFSYDMYSQVGRALRDPAGLDPLGGLRPQRLLASGESQSAIRMVTYVNAVHPVSRIYDGFLIHSRGGGGAMLSQAPQAPIAVPVPARIRTDLSEPVLTFQTETDLFNLGSLAARQDDGPLFRLWEVAGTAHVDSYTLVIGFTDKGGDPRAAELQLIAKPIPGFIECNSPINSGYQHFVLKAAIAALDAWVRGDGAPPLAPRMDTGGDPVGFLLDEFGNVTGGIRTPIVDVPIATLSGLGQNGGTFCGLAGTTLPFSGNLLAELYPSHAGYVAAVAAATDRAVAAGFIRPADAPLIKAAAEQSAIGG
ncbi:MAG: alpha/beta hydrolase domain-containing protein [Deltaproteobacteria bacterium]|nr:alpha/beta hydrolase domain-containing protein [Deltaproteobacteria bacterium]